MPGFVKDTNVKYVNKDFQTLKSDLIAYAKAHFSGSFQDFNEASPGMAILEFQAYIGDVLSYYMDQQFLEMKQETARQLSNVEAFAKQLGYRPKGKRAARVDQKFIFELPWTFTNVPNVDANAGYVRAPDYTFAPVLKAGTQVEGPNGIIFETVEDLDFSIGPSDVAVSRTGSDGAATNFAVRRAVECVAGTTVTTTVPVTDFQPYLKITLPDSNVQEIISVTDSDGYTWYEVDFLSQNVVFEQLENTDSDSDVVPYVLKLKSAPRRFVFDYSVANDEASLQFGPGQGLKYDDELIPSIANLSLPIAGRTTLSNFSLDPQNFLKTRSLGLAPYNTTLTIKYRTGGGAETNVPSRSVKTVAKSVVEFRSTTLDQTKREAVEASIETINLKASEGGGAAETIDEIKVNAGSYFASQRRCVTREDYLAHVLSMPERFGRPEKAYIKLSENNPFAVDIHVLSLDSNKNLSWPSVTLKRNISTWLSKLRMMTEGVNILDGAVINIGVQFGVVISPRKTNRSEVMTNCITTIRDYLDVSRTQIGQPIVISDLESVIQKIDGVISVYKLNFVSFYGTVNGLSYTTHVSSFDVNAATKHGIIYCPPGAIFEVRHPESDIVGESK